MYYNNKIKGAASADRRRYMMVPIVAAIIAVMLAVCAAAVYASKRINREAPRVRGAPDAAKISEWSKLAAGHDPKNAYQAAAARGEAYQVLADMRQAIEKALPGSMKIALTLKNDSELVGWTLENNLFRKSTNPSAMLIATGPKPDTKCGANNRTR